MSVDNKPELRPQINFEINRIPLRENLDRFAVSYTPEIFTEDEQRYLRPFFTNLDGSVYIVQHLPEEVIAALGSRYSRSTESLRRTFLKEYVAPIIRPEEQKAWESATDEEKSQAFDTRDKFLRIIDFLNETGGVDYVVNIQRARKFFDVWLDQFGDDSIAELAGVHLCIEGISNLTMEELVNQRIGSSLIVKSSRFVTFSDRNLDGGYKFVEPGEIRGTELGEKFQTTMKLLFETYSQIEEPYLEYIKELYPQGEDEPQGAFNKSRSAKRYDDIRGLLPFATQNNLAFYANARTLEGLINRLADHPIGENRWLAQKLYQELTKVIPSMVRRTATDRGAVVQIYRQDLIALREKLMGEIGLEPSIPEEPGARVNLIAYTPEADVEVLTAFLFSGRSKIRYQHIRDKVKAMTEEERAENIKEITDLRKMGDENAPREAVRFRKAPRAFENAHYLFEIWGRGGDYRDLHRHRQMTEEHQPFTSHWGYDIEPDLLESPFAQRIHYAMQQAAELYSELEQVSPYIAQYAVPYDYIQHWYINISARELHWKSELRTGPQGRPHYRKIMQMVSDQAREATPAVFQGMMDDHNDYQLARRESEIKAEIKRQNRN